MGRQTNGLIDIHTYILTGEQTIDRTDICTERWTYRLMDRHIGRLIKGDMDRWADREMYR